MKIDLPNIDEYSKIKKTQITEKKASAMENLAEALKIKEEKVFEFALLNPDNHGDFFVNQFNFNGETKEMIFEDGVLKTQDSEFAEYLQKLNYILISKKEVQDE